jgi:four helix bundle protein
MRTATTFGMCAQHVQELAAFQLCDKLMKTVEAVTAKGSVTANRDFCNQINDAALDAASDVAEGFVRFYPREFARFLDYALSSLEEVRLRAEAGYRRRYFNAPDTSEILNLVLRSDKAVRRLRAYLWTVKKEDLPPRPERARPQLRARSCSRNRDAKRGKPSSDTSGGSDGPVP